MRIDFCIQANNTRNQGMLFLCEALEENNTLTALRLVRSIICEAVI